MKLLRTAIWINFGWAVLMLFALGVVLFLRLTGGLLGLDLVLLFLAAFSYAAVAFAAVEEKRWAFVICFLVAVGLLVFWLPWVVLNFHAFVTDDPLYQDSPGTILVVAVNALIFCLPALMLVVAYILRFGLLLRYIRGWHVTVRT